MERHDVIIIGTEIKKNTGAKIMYDSDPKRLLSYYRK